MSPAGCSDVTSLKGAQLRRRGERFRGADVPSDTRRCRGHRAGDAVILELPPCLCRCPSAGRIVSLEPGLAG